MIVQEMSTDNHITQILKTSKNWRKKTRSNLQNWILLHFRTGIKIWLPKLKLWDQSILKINFHRQGVQQRRPFIICLAIWSLFITRTLRPQHILTLNFSLFSSIIKTRLPPWRRILWILIWRKISMISSFSQRQSVTKWSFYNHHWIGIKMWIRVN